MTFELYAQKVIEDRELLVIPLTYGRARITSGKIGSYFLDDGW